MNEFCLLFFFTGVGKQEFVWVWHVGFLFERGRVPHSVNRDHLGEKSEFCRGTSYDMCSSDGTNEKSRYKTEQ